VNRREFLSRFFKGVAVASIAPAAIVKACEEHQILAGTTYSFGNGPAISLPPSTLEGYRIGINSLTYIRKQLEKKTAAAAMDDYMSADAEHRKETIERYFNNVDPDDMPDRMIVPVNEDDTVTLNGKRYNLGDVGGLPLIV
jgi:hypothetical protein